MKGHVNVEVLFFLLIMARDPITINYNNKRYEYSHLKFGEKNIVARKE